MDAYNLTDPHPKHGEYLTGHPIHSHRRGVEVNGFTWVANYVGLFIRAEDAPPHVWPVNAADWGFIEYLPSQKDMTPEGGGHPALNHNGDLQLVHGQVYPAFTYK